MSGTIHPFMLNDPINKLKYQTCHRFSTSYYFRTRLIESLEDIEFSNLDVSTILVRGRSAWRRDSQWEAMRLTLGRGSMTVLAALRLMGCFTVEHAVITAALCWSLVWNHSGRLRKVHPCILSSNQRQEESRAAIKEGSIWGKHFEFDSIQEEPSWKTFAIKRKRGFDESCMMRSHNNIKWQISQFLSDHSAFGYKEFWSNGLDQQGSVLPIERLLKLNIPFSGDTCMGQNAEPRNSRFGKRTKQHPAYFCCLGEILIVKENGDDSRSINLDIQTSIFCGFHGPRMFKVPDSRRSVAWRLESHSNATLLVLHVTRNLATEAVEVWSCDQSFRKPIDMFWWSDNDQTLKFQSSSFVLTITSITERYLNSFDSFGLLEN